VKILVRTGYLVTVLDDLSGGFADAVPSAQFILLGLTQELEATAEPRRFTASDQAKDMGIDGFLSQCR
jgi:hypothetical protein